MDLNNDIIRSQTRNYKIIQRFFFVVAISYHLLIEINLFQGDKKEPQR